MSRTMRAVVIDASAPVGRAFVPLAKVYALDEIVQAHRDMESGAHAGKLVVRIAG